MARTAEAKGDAHDAQVITEDHVQGVAELTATPDTVLHADLEAEHRVRLERARTKVEKAERDLKDAREEVARLDKESR